MFWQFKVYQFLYRYDDDDEKADLLEFLDVRLLFLRWQVQNLITFSSVWLWQQWNAHFKTTSVLEIGALPRGKNKEVGTLFLYFRSTVEYFTDFNTINVIQ